MFSYLNALSGGYKLHEYELICVLRIGGFDAPSTYLDSGLIPVS